MSYPFALAGQSKYLNHSILSLDTWTMTQRNSSQSPTAYVLTSWLGYLGRTTTRK
jgi:hypothetical protein